MKQNTNQQQQAIPNPAGSALRSAPSSTSASNQSSYPTTPPASIATNTVLTPERAPRIWSSNIHSNPHQTLPPNAFGGSGHNNPSSIPQANQQHSYDMGGGGGAGFHYSGSLDQMDYSPSAHPPPQPSRPFTQVQIDPSFEQSELLGLDLSNIKLRSLPVGLFSFDSLFELRLNGNMLSRIPPQIAQLKNLVVLDLSDNALVVVPREIGKLVNLQELLLYNNQLTSLPPEMGYLYQLENLGIDGNPLQEPLPTLSHAQGSTSIITYLREHVLSKLLFLIPF
jgi:Leucine-rich repeat (LRR) protein